MNDYEVTDTLFRVRQTTLDMPFLFILVNYPRIFTIAREEERLTEWLVWCEKQRDSTSNKLTM